MRTPLQHSIFAILILAATFSVSGQFSPEPFRLQDIPESVVEKQDEKSSGQTIWSEDFGGGIPQAWLNVNQNGFCGFRHTSKGPQGPLSKGMPALKSTSAGNGFVILDADLCTSQGVSGTLTDAWLQSPPINVPAGLNLRVRFQHSFRYCCSPQSLILLEVSTNGTDWTGYDVRNGLSPNNTSANPVNQVVDISQQLAGGDQIWIRFRQSGTSHYWWMIDDISIESFVDNDLEVINPLNAGGYARIPAGQLPALELGADVRNNGGKAQSNLVFSVAINDYLFRESITRSGLNPNLTHTFKMPQPFVLPGRGTYHVNYQINQQQQDQVPDNNQFSFTVQITDSTYSRTGNADLSGKFIATSPNTPMQLANRYDIYNNMEITSLSFVAASGTQPGSQVQAKIFRGEAGVWTEVFSSGSLTLASGNITPGQGNNPVWVNIPFAIPVAATPGKYLAVVSIPTQPQIVRIAAKEPVNSAAGTAFISNNNQWVESDLIPYIDLHFGKNVADCAPRYHTLTKPSICGLASGSIEVIPLNGVAPWIASWDKLPGITTLKPFMLQSGDYAFTITDETGCKFESVITVNAIEITLTSKVVSAVCNTNGMIEITPDTGTHPFSFRWQHDNNLEGSSASGLSSGNYTVKAVDKNGCEATLVVSVPNYLQMPVQESVQDALCGTASGSIELQPQAGMAPFTFTWADDSGNGNSFRDGLLPGNYRYTVADAGNCIRSSIVIISQKNYTVDAVATAIDATCGLENGSVLLDVTSGQAPYIYLWNNGSSEKQPTGLKPGSYTVQITDKMGCKGAQTVVVGSAGETPQVVWETTDSPGCGTAGGSFRISPVTPGMGYIYTLLANKNEKDYYAFAAENKSVDFAMNDITAGIYRVKVASNDGCEITLSLNVSDQGAPAVNATVVRPTCWGGSNGAVSLQVDGSGTFTFLWNDQSASTTARLQGIKAGKYSVIVTGGNCKTVKTIDVEQPAPIVPVATISHIVCANEQLGSINVTHTGGTAPFSFFWSNGTIGRHLNNVKGGKYTITITDFNNCTGQQTFTIEANDALLVNTMVQEPDFNMSNGSIALSVNGGVGNYSYQWDHGAQSALVTGLAAGTYNVTVTDQAGCKVMKQFALGATNVDDTKVDQPLMVYPNPARDVLFVKYTDSGLFTGNELMYIEIINILGEKVIKKTVSGYDEGLSIDVAHLPKGVYIIMVSEGKTSRQTRFIKR